MSTSHQESVNVKTRSTVSDHTWMSGSCRIHLVEVPEWIDVVNSDNVFFEKYWKLEVQVLTFNLLVFHIYVVSNTHPYSFFIYTFLSLFFKCANCLSKIKNHILYYEIGYWKDAVSILNIYIPNPRVPQFVKETLLQFKPHIDPQTLIIGDFNTVLSLIDRLPRQKLNRELL